MGSRRVASRLCVVLFVGTILLGLQGCSYLQHRGEDLLDMMDFGVTYSTELGFAAYYDLTPFIPIGYGNVDGYFIGVGGGQVGHMRHYEKSLGVMLYGKEEVGFGEGFDKDKPETVNAAKVGLLGAIEGPVPGPDYFPTCLHYFHFGYVGGVWNLRYLQMLDFMLGWTTLDICFDDGVERGGAERPTWGGKSMFGGLEVLEPEPEE